MRRAAPAVVVLMAIAAACGDPSATNVVTQSSDGAIEEPFASSTPPSTVPPPSTSPPTVPPTVSPATPSAVDPPTTGATAAPPEPTMYRPEPVRSGPLVTAIIVPAEGVTLDGSSVTFQIVEMPDGRFLQVDRGTRRRPGRGRVLDDDHQRSAEVEDQRSAGRPRRQPHRSRGLRGRLRRFVQCRHRDR